MKELFIEPARLEEYKDVRTGLLVRAKYPGGKTKNADIALLTSESLLAWLRSRGGDNPWAEDVVGILLGHGHLHDFTKRDNATIEELDLSRRVENCIDHVARHWEDWHKPPLLKEIASRYPREWLRMINFGEKSLQQLAKQLVPLADEYCIKLAGEEAWRRWAKDESEKE